jgi:hypothetical protein
VAAAMVARAEAATVIAVVDPVAATRRVAGSYVVLPSSRNRRGSGGFDRSRAEG